MSTVFIMKQKNIIQKGGSKFGVDRCQIFFPDILAHKEDLHVSAHVLNILTFVADIFLLFIENNYALLALLFTGCMSKSVSHSIANVFFHVSFIAFFEET